MMSIAIARVDECVCERDTLHTNNDARARSYMSMSTLIYVVRMIEIVILIVAAVIRCVSFFFVVVVCSVGEEYEGLEHREVPRRRIQSQGDNYVEGHK